MLSDWSPTDWSNAVAGEVGEACNFLKKLRRLTDANWEMLPGDYNEASGLAYDAGKELADAVTYIDLLAARLGFDLGELIRDKFNAVSDRVKSEVRL